MSKISVLLDTSFFLRLYDPSSPLHENAKAYYKYFAEHDVTIKISTIAIAEFCVKGEVTDLPLRNLQIVPFNFDHAKRAGKFLQIILEQRKENKGQNDSRTAVTNDTKMFAQADVDTTINSFVSADSKAKKIHASLKSNANFEFIDISIPCNETYGELFK